MKLEIGIMPEAQYRQRCLDIIRGEITIDDNEPKVWFESIESLAKVLDRESRELNALIFNKKPDSLSDLAKLSGLSAGSIIQKINQLSNFGIIELDENGNGMSAKPIAKYSSFSIVFLDNF